MQIRANFCPKREAADTDSKNPVRKKWLSLCRFSRKSQLCTVEAISTSKFYPNRKKMLK